MADSEFTAEVKGLFQEFLIEERKRTDGLFQRFADHCRADMGQVWDIQKEQTVTLTEHGKDIEAIKEKVAARPHESLARAKWVEIGVLVLIAIISGLLGHFVR